MIQWNNLKAFSVFRFAGILFCFFGFLNANAQTALQLKKIARRDSMRILRDTLNVYFPDNAVLFSTAAIKLKLKDTTLHEIQIYTPALKKYNFPAANNTGKIPQPVFFQADSLLGFNLGMNGYDFYSYNHQNTRFYRTKRPYTEIDYLISSAGSPNSSVRGDQIFSLFHTQKVSKTLQLGAEFRIISSVGFYLREWAKHTNVRFFGSHYSKNGNYVLATSFVTNTLRSEENGGIIANADLAKGGYTIKDIAGNDSVFRAVSQKEAYPVNLSKADNKSVNYELAVFQAFKIGLRSVKGDTADVLPKVPLFQLNTLLQGGIKKLTFRDLSDQGFYTNYFLSSDSTRFTLQHRNVDGELEAMFSPFARKKSFGSVSAGTHFTVFDVKQGTEVKYIDYNWSVFSNLRYGIDSLKFIEARADYFVGGYNQNNFRIKGLANISFTDSSKKELVRLRAGVNFSLQSPSYIQSTIYSNNFIWSNDFGLVRTLKIFAEPALPKWRIYLGASWTSIGNLIYFGNDGKPAQFSGESFVYQFWGRKDLHFGKHFNWDNLLFYQGKNNDLIRVPAFYLRSSFYYENRLFKKALLLRAGFDFYYSTKYQGYAYNPATRQFQLQNTSNTGNYPLLDLFVSVKIKRFRAFFKAAHINQGFPKYSYFVTPDQPLPDRQFQLGISWGLFN